MSLKLKCAFALVITFVSIASGQNMTHYNLADLEKSGRLEFFNRQFISLNDPGHSGISISDGKLEGGAWISDVDFSNGTIELDLRGKNVVQSSFVGICFHGLDDDTFDAIYFRPFNFLAKDSAHLAHCIQYTSYPIYTWEKLRREFNGQYEKPIPNPPDPDGWIHMKLVLDYPWVSVYINNNPKPVMHLQQLSSRKTGKVGLFVADGSDGDFANLSISQ
ncbi:MAG TPA: hypothetical protein VFV08_16675 [Puia sp.]|nr:hypothetical protein [Puia sp.]